MRNYTESKMPGDKLVTVLMPCYNAGEYLEDAVNSILNQTYKNFEFILIDDGSIDNTKDLIISLSKVDARIVPIFNEANLGLIRTLNNGVGYAKGEFIARMDADDISAPERLYTIMNAFADNPDVDVISAGYFYMSASGKVMQRIYPKALGSEALKFVSFFCTPVNHPCVVVKSHIFRNNLFDERYIHSEDYEIFSRLLLNGYRFLNLPVPLYYLRKNPESVSFKYEKIQISTHTKISSRNIELYFSKKIDFFLHKVMINRISFNVSPELLKEAVKTLDELRNEFVRREKCDAVIVYQIDEFLTEQKIDIYLQSIKSATYINKTKLLLCMLSDVSLFFSRRGRQFIKSKFVFLVGFSGEKIQPKEQ